MLSPAVSHIERLDYAEPWGFLARWPKDLPLCFLGGRGRYATLACDFFEVDFQSFLEEKIFVRSSSPEPGGGLQSGYVGLASFDAYDLASGELEAEKMPCRIWRINEALVFDQEKRQLQRVRNDGVRLKAKPLSPHWRLSPREFEKLFSRDESFLHSAPAPFPLKALAPEAVYLAACQEAIEQIRQGRYYQINLLRYFVVEAALGRQELLRRLAHFGGPYTAYLDLPDLSLASFSPEQFVALWPEGESVKALSSPIKGTSARSPDPRLDKLLSEKLSKSKKDLSELHMIVDLLRNDLNRLSCLGSVHVDKTDELKTFPSVHHLQAQISSKLVPELTWGEFFAALCPGGSITGAPKLEVMQAIREFEGRRRGYFMGNLFYWDDRGHFDSSILIRTLWRQGRQVEKKHFHYAAGSGIVLASSPRQELAEIASKCQILESGAKLD